jgi:hypothetical protein
MLSAGTAPTTVIAALAWKPLTRSQPESIIGTGSGRSAGPALCPFRGATSWMDGPYRFTNLTRPPE